MQTARTEPSPAGKKQRKPATDGQPPPPPRMRKFVLTKVSHVRAELGRLYSEARNKQIDVADASRLGNLLSILARVISDNDLEARLDEIEKRLGREQ